MKIDSFDCLECSVFQTQKMRITDQLQACFML